MFLKKQNMLSIFYKTMGSHIFFTVIKNNSKLFKTAKFKIQVTVYFEEFLGLIFGIRPKLIIQFVISAELIVVMVALSKTEVK